MNPYKRKILLTAACAVVLTAPTVAQSARRIPSEHPKLVIGIVVEQMRSDYIRRFNDKLSDKGFKRLINEGTYCQNADYSHFFMQTAVGYATIYTGAMPTDHGIVADEWYDRVVGKEMTAVGDETTTTIGGAYEAGRFSPRNMTASTLGDELKMSNMRQSKVFGVSLEPVSAILPAGHAADGAFWFDNEKGAWVTSSYYMNNLPAWLNQENDKKLPDIYLARTWEPEFPINQYTECLTDVNPYETGIDGRTTFPYKLPDIAKNRSLSSRYALLGQTPFGNTLVKDLAIALIANENLGKDDFTDLLTVSFTATESIGNNFGTMSIELEDAFIKLDHELEHFLDFVDQFVGRQNVLIFLTSNHGAAQTTGYLTESRLPVGQFNSNSAISLLRSYLTALYGDGEWIKTYHSQQLYLNAELIENSKLKLEDFQKTVADFLVQFTGVSNTMTAYSLQTQEFTEGFRGMLQNSYVPRRSGDVFINLYPGWVEKSANATSHNSAYIYDTRVPLIWYGWKIKRDKIDTPVDITGIAPTIANILNIAMPNASSGKVISELRN